MNFSQLSAYYKSVIRPTIEYASVVFDGHSKVNELLLERVKYNRAAIVCTGAKHRTESGKLSQDLAWDTIEKEKNAGQIYFILQA